MRNKQEGRKKEIQVHQASTENKTTNKTGFKLK